MTFTSALTQRPAPDALGKRRVSRQRTARFPDGVLGAPLLCPLLVLEARTVFPSGALTRGPCTEASVGDEEPHCGGSVQPHSRPAPKTRPGRGRRVSFAPDGVLWLARGDHVQPCMGGTGDTGRPLGGPGAGPLPVAHRHRSGSPCIPRSAMHRGPTVCKCASRPARMDGGGAATLWMCTANEEAGLYGTGLSREC